MGKNYKFNNGFTLVEMITTIGVMVLLLSIVLGINRTGTRQLILFQEKSLLIANINKTKARALQTYLLPDKPCGFGIFISPSTNSYVLFEDKPDNPADCSTADNIRTNSSEDITTPSGSSVEEYELPSGLRIRDSGPNYVDHIIYVPPHPDVLIHNNDPGNLKTFGHIILETLDGNNSVTIQVNDLGQITSI